MQQAIDHTPAWLAFTGALAVAILAAATAQWRQRVEIRHDRHMHDLGELRTLLDECAQVSAASSESLLQFSNLLAHSRLGEPADDSADAVRQIVVDDDTTVDVNGPFRSVDDASAAVLTSARPIFGLYQRVLLRLGQNHSVSLALLELQGIYNVAPLTATEIDGLPLGRPERLKQVEAWQAGAREAHFTFLAACHYLVRSRIADDKPL